VLNSARVFAGTSVCHTRGARTYLLGMSYVRPRWKIVRRLARTPAECPKWRCTPHPRDQSANGVVVRIEPVGFGLSNAVRVVDDRTLRHARPEGMHRHNRHATLSRLQRVDDYGLAMQSPWIIGEFPRFLRMAFGL